MNNPESFSIISLTKSKLLLMAKLLVAIGSKIGSKSFAKLYKRVLIADNIDQKGGQFSVQLL